MVLDRLFEKGPLIKPALTQRAKESMPFRPSIGPIATMISFSA
jgi:hypothetical protein